MAKFGPGYLQNSFMEKKSKLGTYEENHVGNVIFFDDVIGGFVMTS